MWDQVVDVIDMGLLVVDREQRVTAWNQWMMRHSGLRPEDVLGRPLTDLFPDLANRRFQRKALLVLRLGHFAFFSQKLHGGLFPFSPVSTLDVPFERMQQSCTMGPVRDAQGQIVGAFLSVSDVTETASFERRLRDLNARDPLTGLGNRRMFQDRAELEVTRHRRYRRPLSLAIVDLDHFKRVNDTLGHLAGDEVLREIAGRMQVALRETDLVTRFGGEEFTCLLPETDPETAMAIGERLRRAVEATPVQWGETPIPVSASIGLATSPEGCEPIDSLLTRADAALYTAKLSGRNQVRRAELSPCRPMPRHE